MNDVRGILFFVFEINPMVVLISTTYTSRTVASY